MNRLSDSISAMDREVRNLLHEDIGSGDVTAELIPFGVMAEAIVILREPAVIAGQRWFDRVYGHLHESIEIDWRVVDGDQVEAGQTLCTLRGPASPMLTGERTALNLLQTLSGTATITREYVNAVAGTGVKLLDTRKTLPGLRKAQKYAVRCGGGHNHRMGLYDGILIKENHIKATGSIASAVHQARQQGSRDLPVEVEVETLDELHQALDAGADIVMLDNMGLDMMRMAVVATAKRAKLEASGGITLENIAEVAATGVHYISVGALTKDMHAIDLSMRITTLP